MSRDPAVRRNTQALSADPTFGFQWVLRHLGFGHIDNSVDVERDLLRIGGPALIAEAVAVLAVVGCGERVVLVGDGLLVVLAVLQGVLNLDSGITNQQLLPVDTVSRYCGRQDTGQHQSSCIPELKVPALCPPQPQISHRITYPEVNFEVPTSSEFPVAHLESDSHEIIFV